MIEHGSEGPRGIIAFYYAFLHTARRYSSCAFCPIVIDAPNQQGQDDMQRVMRFIIDKRPADSQVIVATEDLFGLTEADATIVHVGKRRTSFSMRTDTMKCLTPCGPTSNI